jgi:hypothetical protein
MSAFLGYRLKSHSDGYPSIKRETTTKENKKKKKTTPPTPLAISENGGFLPFSPCFLLLLFQEHVFSTKI